MPAKSLLEVQFPIAQLSLESFLERDARTGKILNSLGRNVRAPFRWPLAHRRCIQWHGLNSIRPLIQALRLAVENHRA